jgi:nitroreductase
MTSKNHRKADHEIDELFLARWSPRAFSADEISRDELFRLFEAARWAPSGYNAQPWRFIYARRGDAHWQRLLGLLIPFNASWAKDAAALVAVVSKPTLRPAGKTEDVANYSHSFDAGAAWALLALQASLLGWQAHGMSGFDHARAVTELGLPEGYRPEAFVAIGKPGDKSQLPEGLQARETPSQRDPIQNLVFEGVFSG